MGLSIRTVEYLRLRMEESALWWLAWGLGVAQQERKAGLAPHTTKVCPLGEASSRILGCTTGDSGLSPMKAVPSS